MQQLENYNSKHVRSKNDVCECLGCMNKVACIDNTQSVFLVTCG